MTESLLKSNNVIFCEMMSHPVLFTHPHPKVIAIIGDEDDSISSEVIKHAQLTEIHQIKSNHQSSQLDDSRIKHHSSLENLQPNSLDILITLTEPNTAILQQYFNLLHKDGVLLQASASPFNPEPIKSLVGELKTVGFHDFHLLNFPQPSFPTSWRTAAIALKYGVFKRLREKAIYNKPFSTQYYNFDIHRASMVLPEFMRETII